jgi:hypothetical protein
MHNLRSIWWHALFVLLISSPGICELPQFHEVSQEVGIRFDHFNGSTGRCLPPEVNGGGMAAFDFDGDGWVDLYVVNGSVLGENSGKFSNHLFKNTGGRFEDLTDVSKVGDTGYGMGCVAGDTDNDGDLDLYVSNFGRNVLYRNKGDGTFSDVSDFAGVGDPGWGAGCAFSDYDSDGDLDLYVANYVTYRIEQSTLGLAPYLMDFGKPRTDDDPALYANPLNFPAASNRLYRNEGDGHFVDVADRIGVVDSDGRSMGVVFFDYDGDGDSDLVVSDDLGGNSLFRNNGPWPGGNFSDEGLLSGVAYDGDGKAQATMGVAAGDLDNDGRLDLATSAFQGEPYSLYHNRGNGVFQDVAFFSRTGRSTLQRLGWGVMFLDYDNDGWSDLFFANGHVQDGIEQVDPGATTAQQNLLFRNRGDGRFVDVSDVSGPGMKLRRQSRGSVSLDYDNDGDVDIAIVNRFCRLPEGVGNGVDLLRNDGGNAGRWLEVRVRSRGGREKSVRGSGSGVRGKGGIQKPEFRSRNSEDGGRATGVNGFGIGSRVTIYHNEIGQTREVRAGSGYQSQNDMRLHFGLGDATRVDSLVVVWPDGVRQVLRDPAIDRVLEISR